MATLKLQTRSLISEDQQIGVGSEVRKGHVINPGKGQYGYWVTLSKDNSSVLINFSKSINRTLDASLEGVDDKEVRKAIVIKAFDEAMLIETQATYPATDGNAVGKPKFDAADQPIMRVIAISQGGNGLTETQANASVAKAASFSLKSAMSSRV